MPTRYLKAGVRDSEAIDSLSTLAETLFYRLLVTVDDFGRFDARPSMLKAQCFPIKDAITAEICERLLSELCAACLVVAYIVDGKPYLQLQKWDNKPRASESKFPQMQSGCIHLYADAIQAHTDVPLTVTGTGTKTENGNGNAPPKVAAPRAVALTPPEDVKASVWSDWTQLRKAKKAPVTQTVVDSARTEAAKAGLPLEEFLRIWCMRGSQGLQADWIKPNERPSAQRGNDEPAWVKERKARSAEFLGPAMAKPFAGKTFADFDMDGKVDDTRQIT